MTDPSINEANNQANTATVPAWKQAFGSDGANQFQIDLAPRTSEQSLLDPDELDAFTSNSGLANPSAKLLLVAAGVCVLIFVLWFLVSGAFAPLKATKVETDSEEESPEPELVFNEDDEREIGQLKSELALARQEQQLAALREEKGQVVQPAPPKAKVKTVQTQPRPQPVQRAVSPPPPSPPPRYRPAPRRVSRPAPPPVSRPAVIEKPVEQNPQEVWIAAAQVGSYGGGLEAEGRRQRAEGRRQRAEGVYAPQSALYPNPYVGDARQRIRSTSAPQSTPYWNPVRSEDPSADYRYSTQFTGNTVTQSQPSTIAGQYSPVGNAEELPILLEGEGEQSLFQLPLGESFRARLADSLLWDGSVPQIRGLAELIEPILSREGEEVAPVGSMVYLMLENPSQAGVVKLSAEAIVIRGSESDIEIPLPPNAVLVRGPDGMPLMAERIERGGDNAQNGVNWGGLLFDTARTAAEFGLGNSSDGFRDVYRFQRLENFYDRNFNEQRRNPYRQFQPRASAVAWVLPAGKEVELYINQRSSVQPGGWGARPPVYR